MKKKIALIFGITGQDGSYLAELLLAKKYTVFGVIRRSSAPNTQRIDHLIPQSYDDHKSNKVKLLYGDLTDSLSILKILTQTKHDEIYKLAAQSHVKVSSDIPEYTYNVVGLGVLRILESIKMLNLNSKFLQASSSEMYGNSPDISQNEKTNFSPQSVYASAKVLGYWTTVNYRDNYKIFASNSIMFNHESPRRGINFVTKKIIRGMCEIKLNKRNFLYLGNLEAKRDWGYAKEYCLMLWKMLQLKKPGDYVISTDKSYSVRDFIEIASSQLGFKLSWKNKGLKEIGVNGNNNKTIIKISPFYYRKGEVNYLLGDSSKARKELGWKPKTDLSELISIMIKEELNFIKDNRFY